MGKDDIDSQKYQEELKGKAKDLENGPIQNRSCTDVICCLLFTIFLGGFVVSAFYGITKGDPQLLVSGWDSDGMACGIEGTGYHPDRPYLYWPQYPSQDLVQEIASGNYEKITSLLQVGTCVKECPKNDEKPVDCAITQAMKDGEQYLDNNGQPTCTSWLTKDQLASFDINVEDYIAASIGVGGDRIPFRYDTVPIGGFCVPKAEESIGKLKEVASQLLATFYKDIAGEAGNKALSQIAAAGPVIAWSALTALILGYLFLFVIRCIGGLIIYLFLLLIELCFVFGGLYVHFKAQEMNDADDYKMWMQYGAYALWGLGALGLCCIACCWSAIQIAIAVYKTTAQYVGANLRILLLPLLSWILLAVWIAAWAAVAVHTASIGTPEKRKEPLQFLTHVVWTEETRYMVWYQIFALFWVAAFINGICQFIIAASACLWYFTCNSDTKGRGTVGTALWWGFRFHMGSVAFGSFVIAVVQIIRLLFEWYRKKMEKASGDNKVVKALLCLTSYCLWILEKCVKYISKNAYIQVALTNDYFCKAAWNAFALIVANAGRFGWATSVGNILNLVGVLAIGAVNGTIAFFVLTETDYVVIESPFWPVVVIVFLSIMIAQTFLSIFGFSSDAILQSFLLDEQLRFAGSSRPEYMQEFAKSFQKDQKGGCC